MVGITSLKWVVVVGRVMELSLEHLPFFPGIRDWGGAKTDRRVLHERERVLDAL